MPINRTLLLFFLVLQACAPESARVNSNDLLITQIQIISAENDTANPPTDILIRHGRIFLIGDDASNQATDSADILDGAGKYLHPGLIDGHVHLNEVPGMSYDHEQIFAEIAATTRQQFPRSFLYYGFTTVVDLNSSADTINKWNSNDVRPKAYFCGAAPVFDGYPMSFMPKPIRYKLMPYFLYDQSRAAEFPRGYAPDDHSPTAVVKQIKKDGGICVKTHYEKGFGGRGDLPVPTSDLIKELVSQAHAVKMPVLLHANSFAAQSFGVNTGVDAFAHGMWTWADRSKTDLHSGITDIVDLSIKNSIALQPTIQVLYGEQDLHDPEYLANPKLQQVLPASIIKWYATEDGQWWRQRMLKIPIVAKLVNEGRWAELDAPPIQRVSSVVNYFTSQGGKLLFGSDTPSDPTFANPPGLNGRQEMNNWLAAGVTAPQLFKAATLNNAKFYGLDKEIGSVEVGKKADLLITRTNPQNGPSAYDTIEYIILAGRLIERESLSALSAK